MKQVEKYAERMDLMVEEALRLNVKWSLQELARAVSSDGRTTINPLFKVKVKLTSQVQRKTGQWEGHVLYTINLFAWQGQFVK